MIQCLWEFNLFLFLGKFVKTQDGLSSLDVCRGPDIKEEILKFQPRSKDIYLNLSLLFGTTSDN